LLVVRFGFGLEMVLGSVMIEMGNGY